MRSLSLLLGLAALLLVGCSAEVTPVTAPTTATQPSSLAATPTPSPSRAGPCEEQTGGADGTFVQHTDVRAASHDGYDRITFTFAQAEGAPPAIPRFEVEASRGPLTYDPSDQPMQVDGTHHVIVRFHGASGVRTQGEQVEETYKGPREIKTRLPVLAEAERQSDFEATLSWVLGLNKDSCWKVTTLSDPLRVAIDISH